jgi:hypothetical protein
MSLVNSSLISIKMGLLVVKFIAETLESSCPLSSSLENFLIFLNVDILNFIKFPLYFRYFGDQNRAENINVI